MPSQTTDATHPVTDATLRALLHKAEVAMNTVQRCYTHNPKRFCEALRYLEEVASEIRALPQPEMTDAPEQRTA